MVPIISKPVSHIPCKTDYLVQHATESLDIAPPKRVWFGRETEKRFCEPVHFSNRNCTGWDRPHLVKYGVCRERRSDIVLKLLWSVSMIYDFAMTQIAFCGSLAELPQGI